MICPIYFLGQGGGIYYYDGMDCDTSEWYGMTSHTPLQLGCPGSPANCWSSSALSKGTAAPEHIVMPEAAKAGMSKVLARMEGFPSHPNAVVLDSVDCEFSAADGKPRLCRLFLIRSANGQQPHYIRVGMEVEADSNGPRPPKADSAQQVNGCAYEVTYSKVVFFVLIKGAS